MLRKSLMLTACLCILSAPMAMAGENHNYRSAASAGYAGSASSSPGVCTKGPNGSGEVIGWVKNEGQCRHSSNGQSWVQSGIVTQNYQHSRGN